MGLTDTRTTRAASGLAGAAASTAQPRPWEVVPNKKEFGYGPFEVCKELIYGGNFYIAAVLSDAGRAKANAELIVRAVNAHDDLVAALCSASCPAGGWNGQPDTILCAMVSDCLEHGVCGCTMGDAVRKAEGETVGDRTEPTTTAAEA